jgi:pimeloyl-ACP methyl ester carboxylesterase
MGRGAPTVLLESGIGGSAYDWWAVQPAVARTTRVCAYDRAGLGRSPAGPMPRDVQTEVADLDALRRAAHIAPPYILVGHSMGGFIARLFAGRHRQDLAGLVLVDPSVENHLAVIEAAAPAIAANDERQTRRSRACADPHRSAEVARLCTRPAPEGFPPDLAQAWATAYGLAAAQATFSEMDSFLNVDSGEVTAERRPLGALPLIVLTRGELSRDIPADQARTEWTLLNRKHEELAQLSTIGTNRVVPGANHYIQIDKPDVVIDAVEEILAATRRPRGRRN